MKGGGSRFGELGALPVALVVARDRRSRVIDATKAPRLRATRAGESECRDFVANAPRLRRGVLLVWDRPASTHTRTREEMESHGEA